MKRSYSNTRRSSNSRSSSSTRSSSSSSHTRSSDINTKGPSRCIEIEEKFSISQFETKDLLEKKLTELGFVKKSSAKNVEFMDWYFDLPDPNWILSVSDNWFRYRELISNSHTGDNDCINSCAKKKGAWQIKCGKLIVNDDDNETSKSSTTVYEELEGDEAIEFALSIIKDHSGKITASNDSLSLMDGYAVPSLPIQNVYGLVPFARIKTNRTSWEMKSSDDDDDDDRNTLNVDIDLTDFGHMVGEVEQVVEKEADIHAAKEKIAKTIQMITNASENEKSTPMGKLEFYMIHNRLNHYNECVQRGSIKQQVQ